MQKKGKVVMTKCEEAILDGAMLIWGLSSKNWEILFPGLELRIPIDNEYNDYDQLYRIRSNIEKKFGQKCAPRHTLFSDYPKDIQEKWGISVSKQ